MAPKHIFSAMSILFLSASCYFSRPVHAREIKFFSQTPEYAPAPAPGPATAPAPTQVESGYGLYGSESEYSNSVTPQKELTNYKFENEVTLSETNNNNFNEEMLTEDESSESEQPNEDFYNNNENGYFDNYKSGVTNSGNERQGMSDTRYMESGKYYYDIKSDDLTYQNNNNGYASTSTSTTSDETIDPEVYGSRNDQFNTMEEYYQQNTKEQEYVP